MTASVQHFFQQSKLANHSIERLENKENTGNWLSNERAAQGKKE